MLKFCENVFEGDFDDAHLQMAVQDSEDGELTRDGDVPFARTSAM